MQYIKGDIVEENTWNRKIISVQNFTEGKESNLKIGEVQE